MKNWPFLIAFLTLVSPTIAQVKTVQADWQQEVNYTIQVELDDENHYLNGHIEIQYINNSPDHLESIPFHLWPNAYEGRHTQFAKQFRENGSLKFHFAKDSLLGYIDQLDFSADGSKLEWSQLENDPDIAIVRLPTTLLSGETITITTPFRVKIPGSFSRLGHEGQSYQITQWYPKPAVYDVNGWNSMPYLDQGEFYSEFGSFDVSITLPENYMIAATGVLQNPEEWTRIKEREDNYKDFKGETPESSKNKKTVRYIQDNVHDFAWFADKTFNVKSSSVTLSSGRVVNTYTYGPKVSDEVKYVDEAVLYYSKTVGEYPYDYCTAVNGQLKAGGGMEYPMITVISVFNEEVIVHEVGHNWFYGILGSDERRYPWMDEAINSYFEWETIQDAKGKLQQEPVLEPRGSIGQQLAEINDFAMEIMAYQSERMHRHQPVNSHSMELTNENYGVMVYGKGSLVFKHLKAYLGDETFYKCFNDYYEKWKFKHPLPGDIKASFEETAEIDLSWFFDGIIGSNNPLAFEIQEAGDINTVTIINNGGIPCPVPVSFTRNGLVDEVVWTEPFIGSFNVKVPDLGIYDMAKIDAYEVMFENNRRDNTLYLKGKKPFGLKLGLGLEDPEKKKLNWLPLIGFNIHDGLMAGLLLHNVGFPSKNTEFTLAPMFGFRSEELAGYAHLKHSIYPKNGLQSVELGLQSSRFSFVNPIDNENYSYNRIKPYMRLRLKENSARSSIKRVIELDYNFQTFDPQFDVAAMQQIMAERTANDTTGRIWRFEPRSNQHLVNLQYTYQNKRKPDPFGYQIHMQYGMSDMLDDNAAIVSDDFLKLNVAGRYFVNYPTKGKGLNIRGFFGTFLIAPENSIYHYRLSPEGGKWDYARNHVLMGRGDNLGMFSQQLIQSEAQLKNSGVLQNVNSWIAAVNLESGVPFKLPVGAYMDVFTFKDFKTSVPHNANEDAFGYTGGVYVNLGPVLKIYMPLFDSPFLSEIYEIQDLDRLGERIVFTLNLNPTSLVDLKNLLADSKLF